MLGFYIRFRVNHRIKCQRSALACRFLLCFLFCLIAGKPAYAEKDIIVISSSNATVYQQAFSAFEQHLENNGTLETYTLNQFQLNELDETSLAAIKTGAPVVTIGSAAARYAIHHYENTPIISSFITQNAFTATMAKARPKNNITAVFMDQSLTRLLNLAALLKVQQAPLKIGMVNQNALELERSTGETSLLSRGIEVKTASLQENDNPMNVIKALMKTSDVFIVRPNTGQFNRLLAKLVLQLSMRHKTPVIGFSKNYAQAGALLSLYASPEDIGLDTANALYSWLASTDQTLPEPKEGSSFSIAVNPHIGSKLGITLIAKDLENELRNMEGK